MGGDEEERKRVEAHLLNERFLNSKGRAGLLSRRLQTHRNTQRRLGDLS
jgi:hypothetical protein